VIQLTQPNQNGWRQSPEEWGGLQLQPRFTWAFFISFPKIFIQKAIGPSLTKHFTAAFLKAPHSCCMSRHLLSRLRALSTLISIMRSYKN
jgi:hypothetical protein